MATIAEPKPLQPKVLATEINQILLAFRAADENGLFTGPLAIDACHRHFNAALEHYNGRNMKAARQELNLAWHLFNRAVENAPLRWRILYAYGVPLFLYDVGVLALVSVVWSFYKDAMFLWIPIWAFVWGGIGATLYSLITAWKEIDLKKFRKYWALWFLSWPVQGAILGAVIYLLFLVGFIVIARPEQPVLKDTTLPMLVAFLAGFSFEWSTSVIQRFIQSLGGTP